MRQRTLVGAAASIASIERVELVIIGAFRNISGKPVPERPRGRRSIPGSIGLAKAWPPPSGEESATGAADSSLTFDDVIVQRPSAYPTSGGPDSVRQLGLCSRSSRYSSLPLSSR